MNRCIVGTRGSALAVAQAEAMVEFLRGEGLQVEWRRFTTSGDKWLAGPLDEKRGTGFFTRELEDALVAGEVDLLIHSLKDVALARPAGIVTACIPEREDPSDWLVARRDWPEKPVLATSSVRRARMLREAFPGAEFTWIRGNVPTRVQRVREGELRGEALHGTFLAAAGLRRLALDLEGLDVRPLTPEELLPAPGQGALLAETRADRPDLVAALAPLHHAATAACVTLERGVLAGLGGGCQQPLGTLAVQEGPDRFHLRAAFATEDRILRAEARGNAETVLAQVHAALVAQGVSCA